jgi:chromosomal replication initiator protein
MNRLDLALNGLVVDGSNAATFNAAMLLSGREPPPFSALLVDAGTGAGKSALLQIAEAHYEAEFPCSQARRIRANDLAFVHPSADPFGEDLVGVSLLLIDDIDVLVARRRIDCLYEVLDYMSRDGRRVIMSTTVPVGELPLTDWRVMSRLSAATTMTLRPPPLETRIAIIRRKMEVWPLLRLSDACVHGLAERFGGNGHHLAAAVNRLACAAAHDRAITLDFINNELADLMRMAPRVSITRIQETVAKCFRIPVREMTSARRAREVARPRQAAMYLSKQLTPKSLPDIGRRFGNRDHTTVIHAIRQIEKVRLVDPDFEAQLTACVRELTH